jgi:dephospho-CoA kinase
MQSKTPATPQRRVVVCITGMPGSGKSTVAEVAKNLGYEVFKMGDDVRMEAERRKLKPTDENLGKIMLELRQKGGPKAIAALCERRIETSSKSRFIVIDGIRNIEEFEVFKKLGDAILLAVHASPDRRFEFLKTRGRADSPSDLKSFEARDKREISVGIEDPIARATEVMSNNGTLDELKHHAGTFFRSLKHKAPE